MHVSSAKCEVGTIFLSTMYTQSGVQQIKKALTIHTKTFITI